jgi:hypothetical protein
MAIEAPELQIIDIAIKLKDASPFRVHIDR